MVKVKICGITNLEDAVAACEYNADLIGFIFVKGTPRYVQDREVREIINALPTNLRENVGRVGLFMDTDADRILSAVSDCGLTHVQLHGSEYPDFCRRLRETLQERYGLSVEIIKTFKVGEEILRRGVYGFEDYTEVDYFIFDTFSPRIPGGTGFRFNPAALIKEKTRIKKPFFIAGGLTPANVSDAVRTVCPYGVDVSSGVEKFPGKKDIKLLKEFIENAKRT